MQPRELVDLVLLLLDCAEDCLHLRVVPGLGGGTGFTWLTQMARLAVMPGSMLVYVRMPGSVLLRFGLTASVLLHIRLVGRCRGDRLGCGLSFGADLVGGWRRFRGAGATNRPCRWFGGIGHGRQFGRLECLAFNVLFYLLCARATGRFRLLLGSWLGPWFGFGLEIGEGLEFVRCVGDEFTIGSAAAAAAASSAAGATSGWGGIAILAVELGHCLGRGLRKANLGFWGGGRSHLLLARKNIQHHSGLDTHPLENTEPRGDVSGDLFERLR